MCVCIKQSHSTHLILFVLSRVGKAGNNSGDPACRSNLTGIDHDEELHEHIIDLAAPTLYDVDILSPHRLSNLNTSNRTWSIGSPFNIM